MSNVMAMISIGKAAKILDVSVDMLRYWERRGELIPERSPGGQRRYDEEVIRSITIEKRGLKMIPRFKEEAAT